MAPKRAQNGKAKGKGSGKDADAHDIAIALKFQNQEKTIAELQRMLAAQSRAIAGLKKQ
jgi:hypothetical protein